MSVIIDLPVSNLVHSVERPVVLDVVRSLKEQTGIASTVEVSYYGQDGKALQIGSGFSGAETSDNKWQNRENIVIEARELYPSENALANTSYRPEQPFVFRDNDLDVYIKPYFTSATVELSVKYKTLDRNQGIKWRNDFKAKFSRGRTSLLHSVGYSFHIPNEFSLIMEEIHRLREKQGGYGEDFSTWLRNHLSPRATVLSNEIKTHLELSVNDRQTEIIGLFDFDVIPEQEEKDSDSNLWVVSFTYTFTYHKPTSCVMRYPTIVHNQPIAKRFRRTKETKYQQLQKSLTSSQEAMNWFRSDSQVARTLSNRGLDIVSYSPLIPNSLPVDNVRVFSCVSVISESDKRTLLNLNELQEYGLHPAILQFIKESERTHMTKLFGSVLQLFLYEDRNICPQNSIAVDADLNVVATRDLDIRKTYHLRLGLVCEFSHLSESSLRRLKAYRTAAILIIQAINQALSDNSTSGDLRRRRISPESLYGLDLEYREGLPYPADGDFPHDIRGHYGFWYGLVQTLFVQAVKI
jgi:hypothetical protein